MFYIHRSIHPSVVTVAVAGAQRERPLAHARPLARATQPLTPSTESRTPPPRPRVSGSEKKENKRIHTLMETARVADTAVAVVVVLVVAYIVVTFGK